MRKVRFLGCICLYNLSRIGGADTINVPKGISILGAFFPGEEGVGGRR